MEISTDDGRHLRLSTSKRRLLLGILLLHANRTITDGALIECLWGQRPPRSATANLRTHVSVIRRILRSATDSGSARLVTCPGGYRFEVEPESLDVALWKRLVPQGRAMVRGSDLAGGVAMLERALGLWRGRVLEDLELEGPLHAAVADLEEQRVGVLEDLVEVRLRLGEHAGMVDQLRVLARQHPWRERLWGQLMLALYRTGRLADALAVYQQLRAQMVEELGLDPGPELRRLHQAILRDDPTLQPPGASAISPDTRRRHVVPAQLPLDVAEFTGRVQSLRELETILSEHRDGPRTEVAISAINGMGGIGKSALAIHAAHRLASRFPDGQLYANLDGTTAGLAPQEVLRRFLRALGLDGAQIPSQVEEAAALFRSQVAGRRLLVLLDNTTDVAQVQPLLPASAGCGVLTTSRRVLSGVGGARHLHLDVLSPDEAVQLLGRLAGADRIAAEPEAAAEVARWCGYLPLALRIAGARLAARPRWPIAALAERLADSQRRLDELELSDIGVRASFTVSYEQLRASDDPVNQSATRAFELLSALDGPDMSVPVAAQLLSAPERRTERVLERLVDLRLLETLSPGRYRMHDLLRLFARELADEHHPDP